MEIINSISLVTRSIIYLWVGVESLFLHYLYNYGYQKFKPTPIIRMLHQFFFYLGTFFIAVAFIPLFSFGADFERGDFLVRNIAAFVAIGVGIFLTGFRRESLKEIPDKNPLLKQKKE